MIKSRVLALAVGVCVAAVLAVATAASAAADPPAPPGTPTAASFGGTPTVGPIFRNGLASDHGCTGSVISSPTRDLLITAAHCVTGTAAGYQFAPGYANGRTPYGVWTVTHAYLDPSWIKTQDPNHDYAILQVAKQHGRGIESVTGANVLALAPRAGTKITDIAYNEGIDDLPIRCVTSVYYTDGYPGFNCHGYVGGSSGSPWLVSLPRHAHAVVGLIGGLHQGGCYEYTSYSPPFRADIYLTYLRAELRIHPDTAPTPGSDGC